MREVLCRLDDNISLVISKQEKAVSKAGPASRKRSSFIGVSKNGHNWQALISVNKRKTYIGSYRSERDAAVAFDFYCILLHSFCAKTNFSYSKTEILDMIANYMSNDDEFKPELFAHN
uniref:AP2/ERF domain-containing protein n=1 Tax=Euplotes harpa TaxID=151035 RepID=A0A7S3JBB2_9SPIT|mmetsp:Transcript_28152/g.32261  ORF Transcript_28152/g.32261 Transcript_28152/m.32261 type:complete len:118 (+) Transcript_28152:331-684(+)